MSEFWSGFSRLDLKTLKILGYPSFCGKENRNSELESRRQKEKRNFGFCRIKGLDPEQGRNKRESEDQFISLPTDRQRPLNMEKGQRVAKNEIGASSMEERKRMEKAKVFVKMGLAKLE